MPKIIVASNNPVKIKASLEGFQKMFPHEHFEIEGVSVASGVSSQPKSDAETFTGAWNRANNAQQAMPDADFYVGIEGGLEMKEESMEVFAWAVVCTKDGTQGKGRTGTFFLPPAIVKLIKTGKELGEADDIVFGRVNSKESNGAVGILTDNVTTRTTYYIEAVVFALIPFKNPTLFFGQ